MRTPLPTPQPPSVVGTVAHERRVLGGKQNPVITTSNIVEARARAGSEHCRVTCDLCGAKREGELCSAGLAGWLAGRDGDGIKFRSPLISNCLNWPTGIALWRRGDLGLLFPAYNAWLANQGARERGRGEGSHQGPRNSRGRDAAAAAISPFLWSFGC